MEQPVKIIEHKTELGTYKIGVWSDTDPMDPRENDNLGTMVCWHRHYNLGDEQMTGDIDDWLAGLVGVGWYDEQFEGMTDEQTRFTIRNMVEEKYIIMPLYIYEHGGITMRCSPYGDPWDSGQVGYIYYDKSRNEHEGYTAEWLNKYHKGEEIDEVIASILVAEVKEYDQFLTGDVYGYEIFRPDVEVELGNGGDSCWGFFGYNHKESGLLETAVYAIECDIESRMKSKQEQLHKHFARVKQWIKQKLPVIYRKPLELNY